MEKPNYTLQFTYLIHVCKFVNCQIRTLPSRFDERFERCLAFPTFHCIVDGVKS